MSTHPEPGDWYIHKSMKYTMAHVLTVYPSAVEIRCYVQRAQTQGVLHTETLTKYYDLVPEEDVGLYLLKYYVS